jgi:glutamyl-tRNA synthetase
MTVKTRIAPSPTGDPHVGTAYIALFNYCFAKKNGGKFVLRIEDTDQTRSAPEYEAAIMRALNWLGIQWDEGPDVGGPCGPYRQSERAAIYQEHAQVLLDKGEAYHCFCTPERLAQMREERKGVAKTLGYDGFCRSLTPDQVKANLDAGLSHVIRLKMPTEGDTVIADRLRGEIRYPNDQADDQVLIKSDGFPTYHLANVVDDRLMGITHVIRAEEWIPSTPKHLRLYEAFGWKPPEFIHMPLLRNKDKSKISKRKNPVSIDYYQRIGIFPEAMLNFLALTGYSLGEDREKFTLDELVEAFDIDRVSLGEPVFDLEKLNWLNGIYVRDMAPDELAERIIAHQFNPAFIKEIAPLIQERIRRLDEFIPKTSFFFASELEYDSKELVGKKMTAGDMIPLFEALADELDAERVWTRERLEEILREFGPKHEVKAKAYFMPVRIAVTGRTASPGLFETMEVIGKPLCQARMREAVLRLKELKQQEMEAARAEGSHE